MLSGLNVDRFLAGKPLALTVSGLEELRAHIEARAAAFDTAPRDFLEALAADIRTPRDSRQAQPGGAVGVIPIRGTLSQHARGDFSSMLFGGATYEGIAADLRAMLADPAVERIVLDIDSPGGSTFGMTELAAEIYQARSQKPIAAVANSLAASAAYDIASQASEVFVTPGGQVGSIGVLAIHQDISAGLEQAGVKTTLISAGRLKTAGNQFEPLDDETRARVQERINEAYAQFVDDVARGRGVTAAAVREGYGEGDVLTARQALAAGMVDGILTLEQVIARPATGRPSSARQGAELDTPAPQADAEGLQRLRLLRWQDEVAQGALAKGN